MNLMDKMKEMVNSMTGAHFFRVGTGKQSIRILGGPEIYMAHFVQKMSGFAKRTCKGHHCDICKNDPKNTPKMRALFVVLDRFDGKVKWFETGANVLKQIKDLVAYNHISFETDDITIERNGGMPFVQYNVMPGKEGRLTEEEIQKFNDFMNTKDIDKPKNEDICNKCGSFGTKKRHGMYL